MLEEFLYIWILQTSKILNIYDSGNWIGNIYIFIYIFSKYIKMPEQN